MERSGATLSCVVTPCGYWSTRNVAGVTEERSFHCRPVLMILILMAAGGWWVLSWAVGPEARNPCLARLCSRAPSRVPDRQQTRTE